MANPSSAASHPSASHSARHSPSEPQAIWIGAVAVSNMPYGAIEGWWSPDRPGTSPATVHLVPWKACTPTMPASSDVRTTRPRPVRVRSCSAASTPKAPFMPAMQVGDRDADLGRLRGARDRHQTALALGDLVVAGALGLRTVVPEAGDREHHQPGVELVQPRDREAEPVEHADPVVLHQHVGALDQPGQHVAVVLVLEVEDQRLLVAVRGEEVRRLARVVRPDERRPPRAGVVAGRRLDLDHPGAHVAEHHRGVRAGQGAGQVEDEQVGQRSGVESHASTLLTGSWRLTDRSSH